MWLTHIVDPHVQIASRGLHLCGILYGKLIFQSINLIIIIKMILKNIKYMI